MYLIKYLIFKYSDLGDYKKSIELSEKVYLIIKELLGESHPFTIHTLQNISKFVFIWIFKFKYKKSRDYKKSLEISEKIYARRKELLGENHPDTIQTLSNISVSVLN